MSQAVWAAAVAGLLAGCAEEAQPRIPLAPALDPEGAVVATAAPAAAAPPAKMSCSAAMMGSRHDPAPPKEPAATSPSAPVPADLRRDTKP